MNDSPHPPKWANRLLEWFCSDDVIETVQGDLFELYEKREKAKGRAIANLRFVRDVLSIYRPFALKKKRYNSNNYAMFKNYYRVAVRNMMRHKMYSSIKIGGFALGIAACILISMFLYDELNYDKNYPDGDRIYRVINQWNEKGDENKWPAMTAPFAGVVRNEIPEVEIVGRIIPYNWFLGGNNLFRSAEATQNTYEERFVYADQEFIDMLGFRFVAGDPKTALSEPNTLVISQRKAEKHFPGINPIGKTIFLNDDEEDPRIISGVMETLPSNTHFDFDFILPLKGVEFWKGEQSSWCCSNYETYVKLRPDADHERVLNKLVDIRDKYYVTYLRYRGNQAADDVVRYRGFELQPVEDVHLHSTDIGDRYNHGDIKIIWMFGVVAILILLLACINFINLSTAKSANRAKEVGLRKVVGSARGNLIMQFLTESVLLSLISFSLGILIARVSLPYFNELANKSLTFPFDTIWFIPGLLASVLFIGFLAGIYPSFFLSSFKPIEVLKGKLSMGSKSSSLQGSMVIFQFAASVILIIGAVVVNRQMNFILNKKLGFNKDHIAIIQGTNTLEDRIDPFKEELKKLPQVKNATATHYFPVSNMKRDQNAVWIEGRQKIDIAVGAQFWRVDYDYIETMGMKVVQGRDFSREMASDSIAIIINQTMADQLGFDDPIGKRITNGYARNIIGIVEDFHFESVTDPIEPLAMVLGRRRQMIAVKVSSEDLQGTMASITDLWDSFMPNQPIRYEFMDQRFAEMYDDVKRTGIVFTSFAILAIVIACLGLFALSAFMVEQKRKEIGIRKVLGATFRNLFHSLSSNFLKLITISLIVAFPLGWYTMKRWLENYEYGIEVTWEILAISGLTILIISIATISYEIVRAVRVNPAETLHSE